MTTDDLQFYSIVGVVVFFVTLYIIVRSATKASKREAYEKAQLELLAKIARVQGVPQDEIDATFQAAGLSKALQIPEGTSINPNPTLK